MTVSSEKINFEWIIVLYEFNREDLSSNSVFLQTFKYLEDRSVLLVLKEHILINLQNANPAMPLLLLH